MGRSIQVLHVDDEPDFAELTVTVLEQMGEGFSVDTATSATEGVELLAQRAFDCVVSDYEMPRTNGIEFLQQVRETHPDLPFLLFAGKGSEAVASDAISAGVTDYLQKRGGREQYELLANRITRAVEQYRTERELERQNDLFRKAQDIANVGAWEYDAETEEYYVTDQVLKIHGLPAEAKLPPERSMQYYHPEDRPEIREAFERGVEEGEPYDLELRLIDDDGELRWVRTRGFPQFEDGSVIRLRGSTQDVTERKQRQSVLRALHEDATEIQTAETVEEICEYTVSAAAEILQMDLCTVVVREGEWLVPRASSAETLPDGSRPMRIDQGLAGKTYGSGEAQVVDDAQSSEDTDPAKETYRSGISVPLGDHGVFQAVSTEAGAFDEEDVDVLELLLSHTENAMDRIERERELKRRNDRLEEFASIVSHDLRNPLNVAQLHLEMFEQGDGDEDFDAVERSHDRMESLIDELLTLARAGERVDDPELVNLEELVRACWQNVDTEAATLEATTDRTLRADEFRLQQLLENLFRNSVEHGATAEAEDDESVRVRVGDLEDGFYVADDGPGIPPETRGEIFESGFTTEEGGTGFGLAIVRDIVQAHGWEITVGESEAGGARFDIRDVDGGA